MLEIKWKNEQEDWPNGKDGRLRESFIKLKIISKK